MQELKNNKLLTDLSQLIEQGKEKIAVQVNSTMTLVYWQIGKRINEDILQNERAEYGKEIVKEIANKLTTRYGRSFAVVNLRRMMQFASVFYDFEIVVPLARQLSWSHFIILIPIENEDKRLFYAQKTTEETWGKRELRHQIERKAYERSEIANVQLPSIEKDIQHTFKDPYFLDFLGLKDGYLENDLESAILKELELFILELGGKFAFVERQKRMIIDGQDFYLDLLFYHRKLKRLVAIELKIGKFKAAYKGQMELYLKWLNKYEKEEGEAFPIGLILCAEASSEQIELLEMHKDGIMVAEYWTDLPPKAQLEAKIHSALVEAKERLERRRLL
jgi:predicted nuclease of restriction endonuclease-like (RecB) superfamily